MIASYWVTSLAAQDLPASLVPNLQPHLEAAAKLYQAAKPDINATFVWPTGNSAPIPCQGSEAPLKLVGGVMGEPDAKTLKMYADIARKSGMLPGAVKPPEYRTDRFHIVKAQCKDGKLDGEAEGWMDYVMINPSPVARMESSYRVHFKAIFVAGKEHYEQAWVRRLQNDSKTTYSDPAIEKMMASQAPIKIDVATFLSASDAGNVTVMVMSMNRRTKVTTMVTDVEQLKPISKMSVKTYIGATLMYESRMRDDQAHGWQIVYPHFDPLVNVQVPGSKLCFEEGEMIKSNDCKVD
jgi:hypothetical protein